MLGPTTQIPPFHHPRQHSQNASVEDPLNTSNGWPPYLICSNFAQFRRRILRRPLTVIGVIFGVALLIAAIRVWFPDNVFLKIDGCLAFLALPVWEIVFNCLRTALI